MLLNKSFLLAICSFSSSLLQSFRLLLRYGEVSSFCIRLDSRIKSNPNFLLSICFCLGNGQVAAFCAWIDLPESKRFKVLECLRLVHIRFASLRLSVCTHQGRDLRILTTRPELLPGPTKNL